MAIVIVGEQLKGRIRLEDIVSYFRSYYEGRRAAGLVVEKKNSIFAKGGYTDKEAERNSIQREHCELHLLTKGGTSNHEDRGKIRQIRQHRHMTQRELGEKIGLGKNRANRIAQYEMGYRTPERDQLNKIAHALNVLEEMFSLEADETLQASLHNLLWLDQDDTTLIELSLQNQESWSRPCNQTEKGCVAIVIHDEAVQNFLGDWRTEKSLLEDGAITQEDYFDWKICTPRC